MNISAMPQALDDLLLQELDSLQSLSALLAQEHDCLLKAAADQFGIESIYIAPPNADDETLKTVARLSSGYTYLLSRAGVTGAETRAQMPVDHLLTALKEFGAPPALLGFGISEPAQVREAIAAGAAGAISGSAVVKIIEQGLAQPAEMLLKLQEFVSKMKAATHY